MGKALKIRDEMSAEASRRAARQEKGRQTAARMYAIAHALDGLSRAEAARAALSAGAACAARGVVAPVGARALWPTAVRRIGGVSGLVVQSVFVS